jgi:GR25 family glycosyltransferase involved in LPS biosynthesis
MKNFIITLKNNQLSESIANECIEQAKKFNLFFEKFDAVNGFDADTFKKILKVEQSKKMRPGALGCALSHITLWKNCLEDNEAYFILEHDGFIIEEIPLDILEKFNDILKLDICNPYSEYYEQGLANCQHRPLEILNIPEDSNMISNAGQYSRGTYGYIIKPHAAKKLLAWIDTYGFLRSDHQLGNDICEISITNKSLIRLHPHYLGKVKSLSLTTFLTNE